MRRLHKTAIILSIILLVLAVEFTASAKDSDSNLTVGQYSLLNRADVIDPNVQKDLFATQDGEQITVIVTLTKQADLDSIPGANRAAKLSGVIRALQALATAEQRQISAYLSAQTALGSVSNFTPFWIFNGLSVTATEEVIQDLAGRADVARITVDEIDTKPVSNPALGPAQPNISVIQSPALWDLGYFGQGIVIASLDSGVDLSHADLASSWRGGENSWFDPYGEHPLTPADLSGHGTATMGVMVGGDASGSSIGVAPQAQWISAKIFNDSGSSTATAIHLSYQWLLDPDSDPLTDDAPQVVNNSWTFSYPGCNLEFELDLQSLRAAEMLPVFAAGNGGPSTGSSYSPANNPSAFAVGAVDNADQIYAYSSQGPTSCGGVSRVFPDLVAPGVNIFTTGLGGDFTTASGTSLAAPHVTSGLAVLLSAYPNLSAADQETALDQSGFNLGVSGADNTFGNGRLDLLSAYDWLTSIPQPTPTPTPDPTVDLALNQPVTVSSELDSGHAGLMAVDGDNATSWQTQKSSGKNKLPAEWIVVDLGTEQTVGRVTLQWGSNFAIEYSILISNDQTNWTSVFQTSAGDGGLDEVTFGPTSARYIQMSSTAWSNGTWRISLEEFDVYAGGTNDPTPAPTSTPTPSPTATPIPTPTQTPEPSGSIHLGDLSAISFQGNRNRWNAVVTILMHDSIEQPVEGVTINYSWIEGISEGGTCVTDADGICTIEQANIKANIGSVSLLVINLTHPQYDYQSTLDHSADGNGAQNPLRIASP